MIVSILTDFICSRIRLSLADLTMNGVGVQNLIIIININILDGSNSWFTIIDDIDIGNLISTRQSNLLVSTADYCITILNCLSSAIIKFNVAVNIRPYLIARN